MVAMMDWEEDDDDNAEVAMERGSRALKGMAPGRVRGTRSSRKPSARKGFTQLNSFPIDSSAEGQGARAKERMPSNEEPKHSPMCTCCVAGLGMVAWGVMALAAYSVVGAPDAAALAKPNAGQGAQQRLNVLDGSTQGAARAPWGDTSPPPSPPPMPHASTKVAAQFYSRMAPWAPPSPTPPPVEPPLLLPHPSPSPCPPPELPPPSAPLPPRPNGGYVPPPPSCPPSPDPPAVPRPPPPPPAWITHKGKNCWWNDHGAYEIDKPWGTAVKGVTTLAACMASCLDVPDYACDGILFTLKLADDDDRVAGKCFRKANLQVEKCSDDDDYDLYIRDDKDNRPPPPPPSPPSIPPQPQAPPPPLWQSYSGHNCWWNGHGSEEVDKPDGSAVPTVKTLDACFAACIEVPNWGCEGVIFDKKGERCYRKVNITPSKCSRDDGMDLHVRTDVVFRSPPPPWSSRLSPDTCDALLSDKNGMLKQMWNKWGWAQLHDEEPCWGWGGDDAFFNNAISGATCNSNWYEGSIGWQKYHGDTPGVLGFDDSIGSYCGGLRRLEASDNMEVDDSGLPAGSDGQYKNLSSYNAAHRRRLDNAAQRCVQGGRNILMLFGSNVHNTGAGYNSCRNLEWQLCAAMGMLPGQQSPTIIFAKAPSELDYLGNRPLGRCGGYSPNGCGKHAYSNDDIYFLEICMFSKICENNFDLFTLGAGEWFHCQVSQKGFRELQAYLTSPLGKFNPDDEKR